MNVPEDQYVQVGTINTRYWMAGEGRTLLLLHGITNSVEDWLLNFYEFAKTNRVIAVDLIGHGKTGNIISASYQIDDLAHFVTGFFDAIKVDRATLIGHSLGGWISLKIAIDHASYVNKLVLVDSAGLGSEAPALLRLLTVPGLGEILGSKFLSIGFEDFLKMQRENWPDSTVVSDEMIRLKYNATRRPELRDPILKTFRALLNVFGNKKHAYQPILEGLSSIEVPILAIWGRQDTMTPVAWTQKIANACPQARIEIFDDCSHDPMVEKSVAFNRVVREFVNGS
jgi:4,5:9,10-diseco-3-hydroxy-5,9,17-trioxoandrosta-1(10),2-diene-4-oate hydrolase